MVKTINLQNRKNIILQTFHKHNINAPICDIEEKEEQINFIFSKRNTKAYKDIILHRKIKTLSEFYNILMKVNELKSSITKERYFLVYGPEFYENKWNNHIKNMGVTLELLTKKYGEEIANYKWKNYRQKQAFSNSYEYKIKTGKIKSKKEFDEYNKSRAVTLENLVKRYGTELGEKKWCEYKKKQAFTNTKEYLKDNYDNVCKRKANTLDNYIQKYGEIEGTNKFNNFWKNNSKHFYSKTSQELFKILLQHEPFKNIKNNVYFAEHNKEFGIFDPNSRTYKKFDFVAPSLNLVIEYYGDHYHGNPKIYNSTDILKGRGQSKTIAKTAWERDEYRKNLIKTEKNFDLIVVWESDWLKDKSKVIERIINYVNTRIYR